MNDNRGKSLLFALVSLLVVDATIVAGMVRTAQANTQFVNRGKYQVCRAIAHVIDPVGCKRDDELSDYMEDSYRAIQSLMRRKDYSAAADRYQLLMQRVQSTDKRQQAFHLKFYALLLRRSERLAEAQTAEREAEVLCLQK